MDSDFLCSVKDTFVITPQHICSISLVARQHRGQMPWFLIPWSHTDVPLSQRHKIAIKILSFSNTRGIEETLQPFGMMVYVACHESFS